MRAVARERFVDTVVDDFVDQMVQAARGCRADVHARTQAHRFKPLKDTDVTCTVVFLAILFAVTSLDFMNIFRHGILLTKKWRPVMHDRLLFIYIYNGILMLRIYYTIFESISHEEGRRFMGLTGSKGSQGRWRLRRSINSGDA